MSIDAIGLVKVPYADVCRAVGIEPAADAAQARRTTFPFVPLGSDGTASFLGVSFASEIDDLAAIVRSLLGPALDAHDDRRGVLVVPAVGWSDAAFASYAAAVEHYGEAGQWIRKAGADEAKAVLERRLGGLVDPEIAASIAGGLGAPAVMQAQLDAVGQMLQSNPDALKTAQESVAAMIGGGGPTPDLMQMAQQMLSQMSPEQQAQLETMAKAMFAQLGASDEEDDEDEGEDEA